MMGMSLMTGGFLSLNLKGCTKLKVAMHLCFTMVASTFMLVIVSHHMLTTTKSLLIWQINCLFHVLELNIYCRFTQHSISARVKNIIQTRWIRAHFPLPPKWCSPLFADVYWRLHGSISILNLQCTLGFMIKQREVSTCQNKIQKYPITFKSTIAPLYGKALVINQTYRHFDYSV